MVQNIQKIFRKNKYNINIILILYIMKPFELDFTEPYIKKLLIQLELLG